MRAGVEDRENVGGNWVCVGIVGFRAFSLGGQLPLHGEFEGVAMGGCSYWMAREYDLLTLH